MVKYTEDVAHSMDCTYCGSDVVHHDPVYVMEDVNSCGGGGSDAFCNYSCLVSWIESEGKIEGDSCRI